jgi:hypothetical protein
MQHTNQKEAARELLLARTAKYEFRCTMLGFAVGVALCSFFWLVVVVLLVFG